MSLVIPFISLEMLAINLYVSYVCSQKKKSALFTWTVLLVFTAVLMATVHFLQNLLPGYGEGNGMYIIIGFLYVIPLKFLYDQSFKYTLALMCSSWIYTMLVFSLAFRIGYMFPQNWINTAALIAQTIIYAISLPFFLKFVRKRFVYIFKHVESKTMNFILVLSFLWFGLSVLFNYVLVEGSSQVLEIAIIAILAFNAVLTYQLFYRMVNVNKTARILSQKSKTDTLTSLQNREALYEEAANKIENNIPFTLLFLDLDRFKKINDRYGHTAGDAYLVEFVATVKTILNPGDGFYRLSGDEFVIIYQGSKVSSFCRLLDSLQFGQTENDIKFQGLSLGCASYPADGDQLNQLLHLADLNMYQKKKQKHRNLQLFP